MPKLIGIFEQFIDLEKIPAEDVNRWLRIKQEPHILENYMANRILYPQTISMTEQELLIDLAFLREIIWRNNTYFLQNSRIVIPGEFTQRFPLLLKLVTAFVDGLTPAGVTPIVITEDETIRLVGSYVSLSYLQTEKNPVKILVNNQEIKVKLNTLTLLPYNEKQLKVVIGTSQEILVDGGELGILIDLRKMKHGT